MKFGPKSTIGLRVQSPEIIDDGQTDNIYCPTDDNGKRSLSSL